MDHTPHENCGLTVMTVKKASSTRSTSRVACARRSSGCHLVPSSSGARSGREKVDAVRASHHASECRRCLCKRHTLLRSWWNSGALNARASTPQSRPTSNRASSEGASRDTLEGSTSSTVHIRASRQRPSMSRRHRRSWRPSTACRTPRRPCRRACLSTRPCTETSRRWSVIS